ncbi:hypothetical protein HF521_016944 [Silurus meridionalis]|uniref:Uncharacterized protein n=1 Tax=Silurus meridionalis TaxID=175797 RepID=A0A8T0BQP0_SILME|nr:hypothetical protein HF521_016944 [Silurus meridionalis]
MSTLPETKYWVTYVPVVVNMTASSPGEQMLYYYSAQVHVVPPQQFSVHLTGFNTCYTLLPEPTTPTNVSAAGMFYYNDQAVYNQTPFPMVPPLQQHPSTKRKRKTIVVRDPNQDNKDIMEEIISEAGRSRKPTLPVGNVFSVPMPLQTQEDGDRTRHQSPPSSSSPVRIRSPLSSSSPVRTQSPPSHLSPVRTQFLPSSSSPVRTRSPPSSSSPL